MHAVKARVAWVAVVDTFETTSQVTLKHEMFCSTTAAFTIGGTYEGGCVPMYVNVTTGRAAGLCTNLSLLLLHARASEKAACPSPRSTVSSVVLLVSDTCTFWDRF